MGGNAQGRLSIEALRALYDEFHVDPVWLLFGPEPKQSGSSRQRAAALVEVARVFYCTLVGQRIVMLHGFVKKSQKPPPKELKFARKFLAEVKSHEAS